MLVTAKLNYLHISPRKVRAVMNVIKGMSAKDALTQLKFFPNKASGPLEKLIKSAIANAEHNFSLASEGLRIKIFKVDGGPVLKRFRPGSRGRVSPIRRKTSNITLILEGERSAVRKEKKPTSTEPSAPSAEKQTAKKESEFRPKSTTPKSQKGFVKRMFQRKSI